MTKSPYEQGKPVSGYLPWYVAIWSAIAVLIVVGTVWSEEVVRILERTISPDGQIDSPGTIFIKFYSILIVFGICSTAIRMLPQDVWWRRVWLVWTPIYAFHFAFYLAWPFYIKEDSIFENSTAVCSLAAAICFLYLWRRVRSAWIPSVVWFLFAMEEISWGQRLIGWNSPDVFVNHNFKSETNLHNFMAESQIFAMVFFALMFSILFFKYELKRQILKNQFVESIWRFILLGREVKLWIIPLICVFACLTVALRQEYVEHVFAIYGLVWVHAVALGYDKITL